MSLRLLGVLLAVAIAVAAGGHPSAQSPIIKIAMHEKLLVAQRLLEVVVKGDHDAIARHTAPLTRISEAEIASWQTVARPEYIKQANAFLLSVDGLREAAARKDTEEEVAEYTNLISSCTRCHAYIRTSRMAFLKRTWR